MIAVLLLVVLALGWWWFLAPSARFTQRFAALIDSPAAPAGLLALTSRSTISGKFKGRPVVLRIVRPREDRPGVVVLTMKTAAPDGAPWKDSTLVARDPDVGRATFDLEGRYELVLSMSNGWLTATWMPLSFGGFPGRFDEHRWRTTLAQMHVLAEWLERK